jgi:hypothetical protein
MFTLHLLVHVILSFVQFFMIFPRKLGKVESYYVIYHIKANWFLLLFLLLKGYRKENIANV